jgi:hypothetical protein
MAQGIVDQSSSASEILDEFHKRAISRNFSALSFVSQERVCQSDCHGRGNHPDAEWTDTDIYVRGRGPVDAKIVYRVNRRLKLVGEFLNLTEEPLREYTGIRGRENDLEIYEWKARFGVNFKRPGSFKGGRRDRRGRNSPRPLRSPATIGPLIKSASLLSPFP